MSFTKSKELDRLRQGPAERIEVFMHRIMLRGREAYLEMAELEFENICVKRFCTGLVNPLVASFAAQKTEGETARAVRAATEAAVFNVVQQAYPRSTDRRWRKDQNYRALTALPKKDYQDYSQQDSECEDSDVDAKGAALAVAGTCESEEEDDCGEEAFFAVLPDGTRQKFVRRRGTFPRRRASGAPVRNVRCRRCGGLGHIERECASSDLLRFGKLRDGESLPAYGSVAQGERAPSSTGAPGTARQDRTNNQRQANAVPRTAPISVPTSRSSVPASPAVTFLVGDSDMDGGTDVAPIMVLPIGAGGTHASPTGELGWEVPFPDTALEMENSVAPVGSSSVPPDSPGPEVYTSDDVLFTGVNQSASRLLLWTLVTVQDRNQWALVDTGSCKNLISEGFFKKLPLPSHMAPPGHTVVVAGDGQKLELEGWVILKLEVTGRPLYHQFGIVKGLPVDILLGGELMRPHACTCQYNQQGRGIFSLGTDKCKLCEENLQILKAENSPALRTIFKKIGPPKIKTVASVVEVSAVPITREHRNSRREKLEKVLKELKVTDLDVDPAYKHSLVAVIDRGLDAFAATDDDVGSTTLTAHKIDTGNSVPFREKLRPLPWSRREFVDREIERLLKLGIIEAADPGKCPYASPIVVVTKKEVDPSQLANALRMCVDYRKLNSYTIKDAYPLPRIDDIITQLRGAKYFASLDLLMGYHQIPIREEDLPKTAFVTHRGLFVFKRMPFGLCNAPATFQRLMDSLFKEFIGECLLVYLDDLLMFAKTVPELITALDFTLKTLIKAGLKCKPRKCQLFRKSIEYLGHIISESGVAPLTEKIDKVRQWPFPGTGLEMLSFLGLCNYYRRLIEHFAEWAVPLYAVSQENEITKTPELEVAFEKLKTAVCDIPTLQIPDPEKPFIVETDASGVAIGAVLKQNGSEKEVPVSFYSQSLSKSERNYSTYEKELYAVVKACEAFRVFLLGTQFTLRTDHKALASIFSSDLRTSSRIVRWVLRLQEYPFVVEYFPGKENVVADALSRIPWPARAAATGTVSVADDSDSSPDEMILTPDVPSDAHESLDVAFPVLLDEGVPTLTLDEILTAQDNDPALLELKVRVEGNKPFIPDELEGKSEMIRALSEKFGSLELRSHILGIADLDTRNMFRIVVPSELVESVIDAAHRSMAHEGAKKVLLRISRTFYWHSMRKDVKLFVASCPVCDRYKKVGRAPKNPLHPVRVGFRGETLAMDILGGKYALPTSPRGNRYILVMIDLFTRYACAVALPDQTASMIADAVINRFFLTFGAPHRILTDQGANFESAIFTNLCAAWRVAKVRTTAYHPACNGACERVNQTIKNGLRKALNEQNMENWDAVLPHILFAYNTSVHSSTGFTPYFLMFGQEAKTPIEFVLGRPNELQTPVFFAQERIKHLEAAYSAARETLKAKQKLMKTHYDLGAISRNFRIGDEVRIRLKNLALKHASKLRSPWSAPHVLIDLDGVVATVRNPSDNSEMRVHVDRLSNSLPRLRYEPRPPNLIQKQPPTQTNTDDSMPDPNIRSDDHQTADELIDRIDENTNTSDYSQSQRSYDKRQVKPTRQKDYYYFNMVYSRHMASGGGPPAGAGGSQGGLQGGPLGGGGTSQTTTTVGTSGVPSGTSSLTSLTSGASRSINELFSWLQLPYPQTLPAVQPGRPPVPDEGLWRGQSLYYVERWGWGFVNASTGTVYLYDDRDRHFYTLRGVRYLGKYAHEPGTARMLRGPEVDTYMPPTVEEFPPDMDVACRFLVRFQGGQSLGPGHFLGLLERPGGIPSRWGTVGSWRLIEEQVREEFCQREQELYFTALEVPGETGDSGAGGPLASGSTTSMNLLFSMARLGTAGSAVPLGQGTQAGKPVSVGTALSSTAGLQAPTRTGTGLNTTALRRPSASQAGAAQGGAQAVAPGASTASGALAPRLLRACTLTCQVSEECQW